ARLHLAPGREGALGRVPLGTVRRRSGVEGERAFLDDAFAGAVERVAEEHQLVRIDVEVRVRGRDLPRVPAGHHRDERAEGEAALRDVARLKRLVHRRGRVSLSWVAVWVLDVVLGRILGTFPPD